MSEIDRITAEILDCSIRIHRELGPGLLESVYETVLAASLHRLGLKIDRQLPIDIEFDGMKFPAAFRADLLVENAVIVEIKSVEQLSRSHAKQLLTYLRLMRLPVGLLLNFSGATMKEGVRRIVNAHVEDRNFSASPRLRAKSEYGA
ncbi:MAG: Fe3+ hydroxamate ABC transporter substrate-binding protein [Novosphingobium sp. 28-62-57]|uniref:GxxExxY protein n=1 Tax=unclassified Novosphingobium TaxID=2644732 RepID=UPI000BCBEA67|nr:MULTISPECIES: GxxExxY protein [unclassified Novosphingobium]OYW48799.1 MAG: Fe3+ hydroxamate ABC transporter substrate-binding protein [Novosphingobium sp. 12-62-10]OYZ12043.1 MAG: Fe3+ hydroxamate ABC transporter substrate-binding protein [Novosphingobium sp. 28-62-57]OZA35383.1 MAG: Fe3+ hydroxamate ABC transporter substrate-binding protein [Novosphingobium sp. 17-62-9]HQS69435.1 GxxExxY protein [Novosphingobium sp.]